MSVSNTLGYYETAIATAVKSFIVHSPGGCTLALLFMAAILFCNKL